MSPTTTARPTTLPTAGRVTRTVLEAPEARWALLALGLFAVGVAAHLAGAPAWTWWTAYLACVVAGGWEPAVAGWEALRRRTLDVDLLMVVAAAAAVAISQVFDAALLIVIFATSGALEAIATRRNRESVEALLTLAPERAVRVERGTEHEVDVADLEPGDLVVVRPGERIGADGTVTSGSSEVDQAGVTGEPLPVDRTAGDAVYAGTLNGLGTLVVRVERAAGDSVVARIAALVEEASRTKASTQLFIEKVEQRYSALVVVATLLLVGVPLAVGASFEPTLLRAMTFMIVASPCAIVLATMPPVLAAMANAGRHGVLVRSAVALERLADVDRVALDKTGTLTAGTPRVSDVVPLRGDTVADRDQLLGAAAAAESASEHPVGRAVVAEARARGLTIPVASAFRAVPGDGVRAEVDGRRVAVRSPRSLALEDRADLPHLRRLEDAGRTTVVVLVDDRPVGLLGLVDEARPEARAAIAELERQTGHDAVLLTGDHEAAARQLADVVGLTSVRSGLLPEDKARHVSAAGHRFAFVGDGVNDAPAMASAHVGVAMGGVGSDLALRTADVVLVRDDLGQLPRAVAMARRARRVVRANLAVAGVTIVVLVTWDLVGHLPLPLGVAGHEGSTVLVALNGLRLLRARVW